LSGGRLTYFHVRLSVKGGKHDEVKLDLSEEDLERQFLRPYRQGGPITVNGRSIALEEIERLRITESDHPARDFRAAIDAADRASNIVRLGGPSMAARMAARGRNVTDRFVTGPPGETQRGSSEVTVPAGPGDRRSVFLVHGRDHSVAASMRDFLRAVGLRVVEWEDAVAATGDPNPYVGDVVAAGLALADGVVVLLTPDDLVRLRPELVEPHDGDDERQERGQARANVIYEAGMAMALAPNRTVFVAVGDVKVYSDMSGRHLVRFNGSAVSRQRLIGRLKIAGLDLSQGGQDWLRAGQFETR
jgi:hypothetical protein